MSTNRRYSHTCLRCGGEWRAYKRKPARCRHCRSAYWNKPRVSDDKETNDLLESLKLKGGGGK